MSEDLYSVEQVADLLNLHVKTVRNYVREGRLKAVRRSRHIEVSSIVEIDAISPETANRLTSTMMAAAEGVRIEAIYNRERGHMKIILVGSMEQNASYFRFINAILEA